MSYKINEKAGVFIVGYNSVDYDPPTAGGTHPIDSEVISKSQLNTSSYEFKTNDSSYFSIADFLGNSTTQQQFFDCVITGHFQISEGYSVHDIVGGTINVDDAMYERADSNFDLQTADVRGSSYHGGLLLAENTRLIGVKTG